MSTALTPDAPVSSDAAPAVAETAPSDETAVASGSVGEESATVDANRFNGLMSAHQKALNALEAERARTAVLEARLNTPEVIPEVTDSNAEVLTELQQLRADLQVEKLETAKARALAMYPAAAPLADLIVGNTPAEIESVTAAIATRMQGFVQAPINDETLEPAAEDAAASDENTPAAAAAPVIVGGSEAPAGTDPVAAVQEALKEGSWEKYWKAKSASSTPNLG